MIWQDLVFLVGSMTSVMFLYPTLRDKASRVPRATSIPSMLIGGVYSLTFFTLGMHFSAFGSFAACTMWSLIALFRNPEDESILAGLPFGERIGQLFGASPQPHAGGDDSVDTAPNSD